LNVPKEHDVVPTLMEKYLTNLYNKMQKHILLGRGRFVHKQHLIKIHKGKGTGGPDKKIFGVGVGSKKHIKPLKFIF